MIELQFQLEETNGFTPVKYTVNNSYQKTVDILWPTDEGSELTQLLSKCQQNLVLIVDCICQERDELSTSPLHSQSQRYR